MSWPCFMIEEADPRVEYLLMHGNAGSDDFHRVVLEVLHGVEWDDAPDDPPGGLPERCPQCGEAIDYSTTDWKTGSPSRMGTRDWRNPETGEVRPNQEDWGPGAMFDASAWNEHWAKRTPDGICWGVVLPPGGRGDIWIIDGKASSGGYWQRSGRPPMLTVTPSILSSRYHGFLTDGVLSDSLPDRPL
jgi:hypothetical protein